MSTMETIPQYTDLVVFVPQTHFVCLRYMLDVDYSTLAHIRHSRKEVFQPHLPVRLPCYDLAPVTSFTLGRSSR